MYPEEVRRAGIIMGGSSPGRSETENKRSPQQTTHGFKPPQSPYLGHSLQVTSADLASVNVEVFIMQGVRSSHEIVGFPVFFSVVPRVFAHVLPVIVGSFGFGKVQMVGGRTGSL